MKKTLAIILMALLVASCAFAATSTKFTKYGNIFKSHEYTLKGTSYGFDSKGNKTGTGSPIVVAEHAGSYYVEAYSEGESFKVLMQDGKYYMISDADKLVMVMPYEDGDEAEYMSFPASYDVQSSGNAKLDGKNYYYEKTKETDGTISTYWYNGSDLYAIQTAESIVYITSVTTKADASLFKLPTNYEVMDLSDLASLFGDFSADDWYSDDSSSGWDTWDSYTGDGWTYDSSSSNWWDDDTDYSPNYFALGQYFGLTESQAEEFSEAMYAIQYMDWGTLNEYVSNGKFDFKGKPIEQITDLASYELTALKKLVQGFKK